EGSKLAGVEDTRLGQLFRVDIRGTAKTARALTGGDLAEQLAAQLSLPEERVRVTREHSHAGMVNILVQTVDPWASRPVQPELAAASGAGVPVAGLPTAGRSVLAGPVIFGEDPDTGKPLAVTVYSKEGARHTL